MEHEWPQTIASNVVTRFSVASTLELCSRRVPLRFLKEYSADLKALLSYNNAGTLDGRFKSDGVGRLGEYIGHWLSTSPVVFLGIVWAKFVILIC